MAKNVITISRQFGSGGRTVGRRLAERLGVPFYDKELVNQVADETGFDVSFIEENGEFSPSKSIFSFAMSQGIPIMQNGLSMSDFIFCVQRQVILKLAEQPCVIVGRGADYVLRDREDCFNVFIHADVQSRAERIVKLYGESEKRPEQRLADKDKKRKIYYKHYTDREWGDAKNYDICLNSGKIGIDKCVELILDAIKD
ncbi:MAG: cytidylate kinase-like family protein [Acutalibacteraceae bacterium]|nr:cytidylate kinase-like family protein [Acutalibacteraceae bacterium]